MSVCHASCRGGASKVEENPPFGQAGEKRGNPQHLLSLQVWCPVFFLCVSWLVFSLLFVGFDWRLRGGAERRCDTLQPSERVARRGEHISVAQRHR